MGFTRSPKLDPVLEVKLAEEMHPLWTNGETAKEIATILEFGVPNTPFEKLQVFHVWNYRTKFNKGVGENGKYKHLEPYKGKFRRRRTGGTVKGKSRYKSKPEETMSFQTFQSKLDSAVPKIPSPYTMRKRAYLILHYWSPLRKAEITERLGTDFKVKGDFCVINLYRKKKYYKPTAKPEPFYLSLELPLVNEVVEWVSRFTNERPFNFTNVTAWKYVKEVFPGLYPHYFRFSYITKGVENTTDPGKLIPNLLADTGLDMQTVISYIMINPRFRGSINQRELDILRSQKIIK